MSPELDLTEESMRLQALRANAFLYLLSHLPSPSGTLNTTSGPRCRVGLHPQGLEASSLMAVSAMLEELLEEYKLLGLTWKTRRDCVRKLNGVRGWVEEAR